MFQAMEDGKWACVFSSDPQSKKRKRWTDGTLTLSNHKLHLGDEANINTLGSGRVKDARTSVLEEGEEIRIGRYTVQVGEKSNPSSYGGNQHQYQLLRTTVSVLTQRENKTMGNDTNGGINGTKNDTSSTTSNGKLPSPSESLAPHQRPAPAKGMKRVVPKFKAPARLGQGLPPIRNKKTSTPLKLSGSGIFVDPRGDTTSSAPTSGHPPRSCTEDSPSLGHVKGAAVLPAYSHSRLLSSTTLHVGKQSQRQQQWQPARDDTPTPPGNSRPPAAASLLPRQRRPFVSPSAANLKNLQLPRASPPLQAAPTLIQVPFNRPRSTGIPSTVVSMNSSSISRTSSLATPFMGSQDGAAHAKVDSMPPFKLSFGGRENDRECALPQQQHNEQSATDEKEQQKQGGEHQRSRHSSARAREGGWPARRVWVPNGFAGALAYRRVFSRAMQEEIQLLLDEVVVARFERVNARLATSGITGCGDRRDPLWRQRLFRTEGVAYYSRVSLFRAGGGRGGDSYKKNVNGWGSSGKKRQQRRRWSGDDEDGDGEASQGGSEGKSNSGDGDRSKLYLKISDLSDSKEATSAYGKGDVWALSETGRFLESDNVVFCRSHWHGLSSQGMLSVGSLGDGTETLRLEAMAGRGGRGSSRLIHAIRCFNARTDLCALDLLRNGCIQDGDDEPILTLKRTSSTRGLLNSIPVLPRILSGGLGIDADNSSSSAVRTSAPLTADGRAAGGTGAEKTVRSTNNKHIHTSLQRKSFSSASRNKSANNSCGFRGEDIFGICLTRQERDAEVSHTVEAFSLNRDQARLLWQCACWFRPTEVETKTDSADDAPREKGVEGEEDGINNTAPVILVHGVFGAGKSLCLVALCLMIDRIALADARARSSRGLPPRRKVDQVRVLLAAGTNVAVDRVLMGLAGAGFDDIARVGSYRRIHKSLLGFVVHDLSPGRDLKQTVQKDLEAVLKTAVGNERRVIAQALQAAKNDSFTADQARRLREARVTGVTCASAPGPLLTRTFPQVTSNGISNKNSTNSICAAQNGGLLPGVKTAGLRFTGRGPTGGRGGRSGGQGYDIVVLDECSQTVEPLSLLPIAVAQPRRLVLVGDPMQLPPPVAHAKCTQADLLSTGYQLPLPPPPRDCDLAEGHLRAVDSADTRWLEKVNGRRQDRDTLEKTLFVRLTALGVSPLLLGRQYRCHPQLSGLANRLFYQGRLTDGIGTSDRRALVPGLAPLTLLDATGRGAESTAAGGSVRNIFEAKAVASLVVSLLTSGGNGILRRNDGGGSPLTAESIGVICLSDKAQLTEVRRQLESTSVPLRPASGGSSAPSLEGEKSECERRNAPLSCLRDVQGAEKDVIILASTRTERLGFIVSPQRLCVALTRARYHLLVVGEKRVLLTNSLWKEIVNTSKVVSEVQHIFARGGGDGDC